MQVEPLIQWSDPLREYLGFVAQFLPLGAVGFRYAAVRDRLRGGAASSTYADATARAARIGLVAILVQAVLFVRGLPAQAERAHVTTTALLTTNVATGAAALLLAVAVLGFVLASARMQAGWPLALAGVILGPLTGALTGRWSRLVNPVHRLAAGLWLGTLFVLVVAGLATLLRDARARDRRGVMAADMVNGFSPLALVCGTIVVLSGAVTAWTHLTPFSSLWTTPYGYMLLVKLAVVAVVFAIGAWNWRRVRPTLGSEDTARTIRRSSTAELTAAAIVLACSAILISLPSPKPPQPAGGAPPAAGPAGMGQGH
jgi:putative copper export protein